MSLAGEGVDPANPDPQQPDPLLKPGAFIDPDPPSSNGDGGATPRPEPAGPAAPQPSDQTPPPPSDESQATGPRPDWLPPGWNCFERVRSSGASAGTRDKYYVDPVTNRRFRSKKEVLLFLETGTRTPKNKRKASNSDAAGAQANTTPAPHKKKKSEASAQDLVKRFNFDDVPGKVKWELTDIYEGAWRPLVNGVDRVPESVKQEWAAAFLYVTLQSSGALL